MSLLVGSGVIVAPGGLAQVNGANYTSQIIDIAGRKNLTMSVGSDVAITYDLLISLSGILDADFATTEYTAIAVGAAQVSVVTADVSANYAKIVIHNASGSTAHPFVSVSTQPNV